MYYSNLSKLLYLFGYGRVLIGDAFITSTRRKCACCHISL